MNEEPGFVVLGRVLRPHGVSGAFMVSAHTEDPAVILEGEGLELWSPDGQVRRRAEGLKGRAAAKGLIITLPGLKRREEAAALKGWRLVMPRANLPPIPEDQIYWRDVLGLAVETRQGEALGRVENLMEAGAGLILAVNDPDGRETLIPAEFIADFNLAEGRLVVDLPPGLLEI